ncbi:hypothetical protein [Pedobacter sp.]|uniref:hypothetical protein n=1 Tax=Pedobacter sp. TaxID=1411316 RepID=UPI00396CFE7C
MSDWNGKALKRYVYGSSSKGKVASSGGEAEEGEGIKWVCIRISRGTCPRQYPCTATYCDFCLDVCAVEICGWEIGDCPTCSTGPPSGPPAGDGGDGGSGASNDPGSGGGGPGAGDYAPNCNPDPDYVVPSYPAPPGMDWILPCGDVPTPQEPGGSGDPYAGMDLSPAVRFLSLRLGLNGGEAAYLEGHQQIFDAISGYLAQNPSSVDADAFAKWAVGQFMVRSNISLGLLDNIYDVVRYQNYIPRDREPTSYNWRSKLTTSDFSNYLTETTPLWIENNGIEVRNIEAFNCHYYAFGPVYATATLEHYPKWVTEMQLTSKNWNQVTGNVQVGDRVTYYKNTNGQVEWVHSAIVIEVDTDGYATKVSSKMGTYQILEHHPRDIPPSYGIPDPTFTVNVGTGTATYPSRIYWRKK